MNFYCSSSSYFGKRVVLEDEIPLPGLLLCEFRALKDRAFIQRGRLVLLRQKRTEIGTALQEILLHTIPATEEGDRFFVALKEMVEGSGYRSSDGNMNVSIDSRDGA